MGHGCKSGKLGRCRWRGIQPTPVRKICFLSFFRIIKNTTKQIQKIIPLMHPGKVENALRKGVTAEKFFTQTILRFVPFGREYLVYGCFVEV